MSSLPVVPFPDTEAAIIGFLAGVLDDAVTVDSEWPENLATNLPVVAASLGGGGSRLKGVSRDATLDIDVLAGTKAEARDLAALVSAHLIAVQGTTQGDMRIYGVDETSLIWLPDPMTRIPRYVLVMSLVVRPA